MTHQCTLVRSLVAGAISLAASQVSVQAIPILIDFSTAYTQDFNTLAVTGTSSSFPDGWTSTDPVYSASTGSASGGDLYSLGTSGSSDRALGGIQTTTFNPIFGFEMVNGTGQDINSLLVNFTGEQWRLGTSGRSDRLDFQYSLNASSLTTGTWIDHDALDFSSPTTAGTVGLLNGNTAANQQDLTALITGLTFNPNTVIWFRWTDFNPSGADDALAIDDFSVQAVGTSQASVPDGGMTLSFLSASLLGILWLRRSVILSAA
jgi:uncharacterized protein